jgi:hypothetical protein
MDINKIFGLFDGEEFGSMKEKSQSTDILLKDYKNHPLFWVGMFKKLIYNHHLFNAQIIKFFDKIDDSLDPVDIDKAGEFVVFTRAWDYIIKVNPEDRQHQEALYHFLDVDLKVALELSLNYFQEQEEYEKCAHLKKNLEFVKLLLT